MPIAGKHEASIVPVGGWVVPRPAHTSTMSVSSRMPTFVLLGLVLLAAALLIAGYGLAVGVGVIAGLALGLVAALAFLAMNQRARSNGHFRTWSAPMVASDEPAHESIARMSRDALRVAGVDAGALHKVIAVGDAVTAAGIKVELIALEVRDDGGVATIVTHTRPPIGPVGHFALVTVADDLATEYVASGGGSGSAGAAASRHELRFAPAPPPGARTLTVRIDQFVDPFPGPATERPGPWEFIVEL